MSCLHSRTFGLPFQSALRTSSTRSILAEHYLLELAKTRFGPYSGLIEVCLLSKLPRVVRY
jgi:hypothetical protein